MGIASFELTNGQIPEVMKGGRKRGMAGEKTLNFVPVKANKRLTHTSMSYLYHIDSVFGVKLDELKPLGEIGEPS